MLVFDWCLQIENTPTIRLPKEAKAEIVAETFAGAAMFGTDMNPTVALSYIYIRQRSRIDIGNQTNESKTVDLGGVSACCVGLSAQQAITYNQQKMRILSH